MDIPKLSMAMSEFKTGQSVSIGMMKKALEMTEQQGQQLIEMMDDLSKVIDIKV